MWAHESWWSLLIIALSTVKQEYKLRTDYIHLYQCLQKPEGGKAVLHCDEP